MVFIAPCFLGNLQSLVSWSLSEEATSIYTLTEFNKAPLFHQSLGPRVSVSVSVSLSLFLANSLEHEDRLRNAGNISLFPSFTFSSLTLDHPGSGPLRDPNKWHLEQGLVHVADSDGVTSGPTEASKY